MLTKIDQDILCTDMQTLEHARKGSPNDHDTDVDE
jgi:hypothetical protein